MKLLGTVEGLSHRGGLMVKGVYAPRYGTKVLDPLGKMIGSVERVVGSTEEPIIMVKPLEGIDINGLSGIQVYTREGGEKRWPNRKGKRRR